MTTPANPIKVGYNAIGQEIVSPSDVEQDIFERTGDKVKYINKTRQEVLTEVRGNAKILKYTARGAFFTAGGMGAISAAVAIAVFKGALAITAIGSLATPLGWALLGVAVVGCALLLARHIYLKNHGIKANTAGQLGMGAGWAAGGFVVVGVIIVLLVAARAGWSPSGSVDSPSGRLGGYHHHGNYLSGRSPLDGVILYCLLTRNNSVNYHIYYTNDPSSKFEEYHSKDVRYIYKGDIMQSKDQPLEIVPEPHEIDG